MAVNSALPPFPYFTDAAGAALENGYIYIGQTGFEARSYPKASYFDLALTIPTGTASGAAIRTSGGFPINSNNAPAMFYVDGDYSISICDRNGVLIYSSLTSTLAVNVGTAAAPVRATDGSLAAVGIGFDADVNTGFVRSAADTMQTVMGGTIVSQQTAAGTVFQQPVSGTGFVSGVSAALDADLTALAGVSATGLLARTGAGTAAARAITGGTGISVTNGDGVAGNPALAFDIATQAEAEAGTNNAKAMTPLRVSQEIGVLAGWHNYDGAQALTAIYDFAVHGTVATVVSPDFADGWEYMLIIDELTQNGGNTDDLRIEVYRATSAAYAGVSVILTDTTTNIMRGLVTIYQPRQTANFHHISSEMADGTAANSVSLGATETNNALVTHTTAQKLLRARLSMAVASFNAGKIYMARRQVGFTR